MHLVCCKWEKGVCVCLLRLKEAGQTGAAVSVALQCSRDDQVNVRLAAARAAGYLMLAEVPLFFPIL